MDGDPPWVEIPATLRMENLQGWRSPNYEDRKSLRMEIPHNQGWRSANPKDQEPPSIPRKEIPITQRWRPTLKVKMSQPQGCSSTKHKDGDPPNAEDGNPPRHKDGEPPTPQVEISKTQGWRPPNLEDGDPPKPKYGDHPNPEDVDPQNPRTLTTLRMEIPQSPKKSPNPRIKTFQGEIPSSHDDEDPPKTQDGDPTFPSPKEITPQDLTGC
ncbi:hypothetical protein GRJ2_002453600 [Grus japonensis]|uniref:Uncharacterized protein n=1 Tax=Grus japonensis TaxID=30415 RepID=A0ABC9XS81_GRUJA